ncbi:MAG TPA: HAD-IA family hydrolase [Terracidiphilus sp.]|jgi:putative hydrolase of the HAD superfamily
MVLQEAAIFPFDVILFDVGGVLLTNGWDSSERAVVLERFGVDRAEFEARHVAPYRAWESGAIPLQSYLNATVFYEARNFTPDEFFAAICAGSKLLPDGAIGVLDQIAASGRCLVGALNNEAKETNEFRFEHFGLRNYFKVALSSCYLGLRKPDAAIYRRALDILSRPAERILFIDDRAENVEGAIAVGMNALLFTGAGPLCRALHRLEVF